MTSPRIYAHNYFAIVWFDFQPTPINIISTCIDFVTEALHTEAIKLWYIVECATK